ncbi:MAG: Wzz/FepE/Etk N-terminal domain-containing protein [Candidatus Moranbacteria bacterium]|nr:Wzz/FepE/Etk N-terminal domain-containing protein [Candidatus Moranbacteria bacterium]
MELKEYIQIFKKNIKIFIGTILVTLLLGVNFYFLLPDNYKTYLNVDVTRAGKRSGSVYRDDNDEFYRLQADERFADTIVKWLDSGRFKNDISSNSGVKGDLKIESKRLSSQLIEVTYVTNSMDESQKIADSIVDIVNQKTERLNEDQKISNWFKIVSDEPYIAKNKINFYKMLAISLSLGVFLGFWVVFVFHYFRKNK